MAIGEDLGKGSIKEFDDRNRTVFHGLVLFALDAWPPVGDSASCSFAAVSWVSWFVDLDIQPLKDPNTDFLGEFLPLAVLSESCLPWSISLEGQGLAL
jgi:hypothetical protein